jgi:hypothetical protein
MKTCSVYLYIDMVVSLSSFVSEFDHDMRIRTAQKLTYMMCILGSIMEQRAQARAVKQPATVNLDTTISWTSLFLQSWSSQHMDLNTGSFHMEQLCSHFKSGKRRPVQVSYACVLFLLQTKHDQNLH